MSPTCRRRRRAVAQSPASLTASSIWIGKDLLALFALPLEGGLDAAHLVVRLYGPIPAGLDVDHKCDATLCQRPDHLRLPSAVWRVYVLGTGTASREDACPRMCSTRQLVRRSRMLRMVRDTGARNRLLSLGSKHRFFRLFLHLATGERSGFTFS